MRSIIMRVGAAVLLALGLTACPGAVPLSTGGDVDGYEDLVASFEANPEFKARFDIFEAQADAIQALQLIEGAITHPAFPAAAKPHLKSVAGQLTLAIEDYTKLVTECPGKDPETGACPNFDYRNAKVLAFRNILVQANREIARLAAHGLLRGSLQPSPRQKAPRPSRLALGMLV